MAAYVTATVAMLLGVVGGPVLPLLDGPVAER
jgi:hypothetical protein